MATQPTSFQLNAADGTPIAKLGAVDGTLGNRAVDVRGLLGDTGLFAYDPSFGSTAACESAITFIDGEKGILLHRGYSIDALTEKATYLEMCYLLLFGELPTQSQLDTFVHDITYHTMVHEQVIRFYSGFPAKAHPMAVMLGVVGALSAFYPDSTDVFNADERMISIYRLLAKMPTIAAMAYKNMMGQPFVSPLNRLNYSENFLNMMFSVPAEPYVINPVLVKALNALLVTQADHEQNASTATVRTVGSSRANPFACIAAGIASLWGPLHGGANEEVLAMLQAIGTKERIPAFIARAKDKADPYRLMGFGHRVYKNYDPRATVMQKICDDLFHEVGASDPLLQLARDLEHTVLNDDYFHQRKLFPNVDFYSGIVMRALGVPLEMFTPMFAVARTAGWLAQWKEMIEDPESRITRPRQIYTGVVAREFVPLSARTTRPDVSHAQHREPQPVNA